MPETAKTISIAQLEIPATSNPTNVLERKATQCLYLIDSAIEAPCSFLDIDVEPFADFIEHAEAQPRSVRLVMAMTLLADVLLMFGHQQTLPNTDAKG